MRVHATMLLEPFHTNSITHDALAGEVDIHVTWTAESEPETDQPYKVRYVYKQKSKWNSRNTTCLDCQKFHAKHKWNCSNIFFPALGKIFNQPGLKPVATF